MITLYTAVGKMKNLLTTTEIPRIIVKEKEYELDAPEFILWSSLVWNIYNYDELKKVFELKCKHSEIIPDFEFDYYLQKLNLRGLVKEGKGCTGMSALHSLVLDMYICPIECSLLDKTIVFIRLLFKGTPFRVAKHAFDKDDLKSDTERSVWNITRQALLSVPETICCVKNGINIIEDNSIVEKVYGEEYDYKTLPMVARLKDDDYRVVKAIVDLYLRKMIVFETC